MSEFNSFNSKDEMLKDLQFIKEAVKKNNNILKYISLSEGLKNVALFLGLIIIVLSFVLLWIINYYGSYQGLPNNIKLTFYLILALSFLTLIVMKIKVFMKLVRRQKKDITFLMLMREVYTRTLLMIIIPFLLTIIVFSVYLPINNLAHIIVPVLAILISLLMTSFMIVLNVKDLLYSSEWLLISGLVALFLAELLHPLIILVITFGIAMLILYLLALISTSKEKSG